MENHLKWQFIKKTFFLIVVSGHLFHLKSHAQVQLVATGSGNVFNVQYAANIVTLPNGLMVTFFSNQTITGSASLNLNGTGSVAIYKNVNQPLSAGDILTGQPITAIYDGTAWQLLSITATTTTSAVNFWTVNGTNLQPISSNYGINISTLSGVYSIAGIPVLRISTSGFGNSLMAGGAGNTASSGTNNVYIGALSGIANTNGSYNTFLGERSGKGNTSGLNNTYIGQQAGFNNTSGSNNTYQGAYAGTPNVVSSGNSYFGASAGYYYGNAQGNNNTFIGYAADGSIGGLTQAIAIGSYATVGASNSMALGGAAGSGYQVNVGIGTGTPQNTLHVVGGVRVTTLAGLGGPVFSSTSGDLYIGTISSALSASTTTAFNVFNSTAQSVVSNTVVTVSFGSVISDPNSRFNTSTNQYTALANGFYSFNGQVLTGSIGQVDLLLYVNGVEKKRTTNFGSPTDISYRSTSISSVIQLNANDLVDLRIVQYSGSSQSIFVVNNNSVWFSGSRIY